MNADESLHLRRCGRGGVRGKIRCRSANRATPAIGKANDEKRRSACRSQRHDRKPLARKRMVGIDNGDVRDDPIKNRGIP